MAIYMMNEYEKRNKILLKLGFKSYGDYLQSDLWKKIKNEAHLILGDRCIVCRRRANIFHHTVYSIETLLGKDITKLELLCSLHYKIGRAHV